MIFSRRGFVVFLISFLGLLLLALFHFYFKFGDDIFGKGLPFVVIAHLSFLALTDMVFLVLPFTFFLVGAVLYHAAVRSNKPIRGALKKDVAISGSFGLLLFLFLGFVQPNYDKDFKLLLYDVQSTSSGQTFKHTYLETVFDDYPTTTSFPNLFYVLHSIDIRMSEVEEEIAAVIKNYSAPEDLENVIDQLDLSNTSLTRERILANDTPFNGTRQSIELIKQVVYGKIMMIENLQSMQRNFELEIWNRISYPLLLVVLFFFGGSLGMILKRIRPALLIVIVLLALFPLLLYLLILKDYMIINDKISNLLGNLLVQSFLLIVTVVFMLIVVKFRKKTHDI